jgi:hypothetical protein
MEFTQESLAAALKKELGDDRAPRTYSNRCKIVKILNPEAENTNRKYYAHADISSLMAGV